MHKTPKFRPLLPGPSIPEWWHHHGMKMFLRSDTEDSSILIEGSAASVKIVPLECDEGKYLVRWEVIQSPIEKCNGAVIFSKDDLAAAFGLSDKCGHSGKWTIEYYGGDVARQGKYIRYNQYLNLPCPGTGHDGDPNVSIEIGNGIREAIAKILKAGS